MGNMTRIESVNHPGEGGASRFFYCAKVSPSERNAGLEGMPDRKLSRSNSAQASYDRDEHVARADVGSGYDSTSVVKNNHPTVKPQKLMRYLCKLITPPGGVILDPFMGSGSTGLAAKYEGFDFVGIERDKNYMDIAQCRMKASNG